MKHSKVFEHYAQKASDALAISNTVERNQQILILCMDMDKRLSRITKIAENYSDHSKTESDLRHELSQLIPDKKELSSFENFQHRSENFVQEAEIHAPQLCKEFKKAKVKAQSSLNAEILKESLKRLNDRVKAQAFNILMQERQGLWDPEAQPE